LYGLNPNAAIEILGLFFAISTAKKNDGFIS